MDQQVIAALGDVIQRIGVPAALVLLGFLVYFDVRPVVTVVVRQWVALHFEKQIINAKIVSGEIVAGSNIVQSNISTGSTKVPDTSGYAPGRRGT